MEKKRLSLLSGFTEVTAKGNKTKQLKEVESGEWAGVGGRAQRGKKLLLSTFRSSILVDWFPHTFIILVEFFFFKQKPQRERKENMVGT